MTAPSRLPMTREEERRLVARFGRGPSLSRGLYLTEADCARLREEMLRLPFPRPQGRPGRLSRVARQLAHGVVGALLGLLLAWFASEFLLIP